MTRKRTLLISAGLATAMLVVAGVYVAATSASRQLPPEFARSIETPTESLTLVRFGPEGKSLLAGGATGAVVAVTLDTDRVQTLAQANDDPLTCLVEFPDGLILAGAASGHLRAWTRPELKKTPASSPKLAVTCAAFGIEQTGRRLVLGLSDGRVVITTPEGEQILATRHRGVKSLLITPDGKTLISSGSEGLVLWLDADSGSLLGEFKGHRTEVSSLVLSPDATRIASGDWNGELRILDVKTRREMVTTQQPEAVSGLAWRGERLVSASWDGRIRVWNVAAKSLDLAFEIDTGRPIHGLSVSPDGTLAATVCGESTIELWQLPDSR